MAINFPSNPTLNQTFTSGTKTFVWNGTSWTSSQEANISVDTTPQLGGDLDINGNDITGTGNINITGIVTATGGFNIGIQSAGVNVTTGVITALNFIGSGNTFAYDSASKTIDISIAGGGGGSGIGISNVVEDTTPQLGGNLDLNSNNITGTGNVNITGNITASNVTVGGTLTYDDVTNVDSIGLITARSGIVATGVVTATSFVKSSNSGGFLKADGTEDTSTYLTSVDPTNTDIQGMWSVGGNTSGFQFTGPGQDGSEYNPDIYLVRGQRYRFVNSLGSSHPFEFRNAANNADYTDGITGSQSGTQDFNVQHDAPPVLKYRCTIHTVSMLGTIYIVGGTQVISGIVTATGFSTTTGTSSQFLKADGSVDNNTYLTSYTETQTLDDVLGLGNISGVGLSVGVATATSFIKSGGTSSQFLKADGSVDTSTYLTSYNETQTLDDVLGLGNISGIGLSVGVATASSFVKSGGTSSQFLKADGTVDSNTYLTSYNETQTLDDVLGLGNISGIGLSVGVATATSFIKSGGTSSQFLKADGSVDSNTYLTSYTETDPVVGAINGIVKADGGGNISAATAGTDYLTPSGDGSGLSGIVTSIQAGTNITVSESPAGNFIITSTSSGSPWTQTGYTGIGTTSAVGIGTIIEIIPYDTQNNGTLSFEGSAGQLFSITNELSSGSIFSVNDISGIPSIDVDADGTIQLAPFGANERVGIGTTNPSTKLHVDGIASFEGSVGIGTTNPIANAKLHVDGIVAFGSSIYDSNQSFGNTDQVLTSIAGFGVSWTTVTGGGTGISNVSDDTNPQLGGNLDLNNKTIFGTGSININGITTATGFSTSGGTSSQFLKADGSVDSSTYLTSYTETDPVVAAINGIVKSNGSTISAATAGTDYLAPSGDGSGLTGIVTNIQAGSNITVVESPTGNFIVTATSVSNVVEDTTPQLGGDLDLNSNNITGTGSINITGGATFSGNVTVGGTLTYDDVTNIDSIGLITARSGINATGVVTATSFVKTGGTSSQFLKADGSVDSSTYISSIGISSAGTSIGNATTLNFIGTGNTFAVNGNTIDISIEGGGGGGIGTYFSEQQSTSSPNNVDYVSSFTGIGTTANIDVAIVPKGTGAILGNIPDGTATGGNKRGDYAVDLQLKRSNASEVASASYSFIGGGKDNTIASACDYGVIVGGSDNIINVASNNAAIVGGSNNEVSSLTYYGAVFGGLANKVDGDYGTVIGGISGTTKGIHGIFVVPASENPYNSLSVGTGAVQATILNVAKQTTNATPTALSSNSNSAGSTNQLVLLNNSAVAFKGTCIAGVTGAGNTKAWEFRGAIKRGANAASTTLVGSVIKDVLAYDSGAAAWDVDFTADTTNGALKVTVTGQAGTTIRWTCKIETTELAF